jgi:predicted aldo/keto reductase-like oxidoreductase
MQYREIGKTGMKAGIVGLGAEHLDGKPAGEVAGVIHCALDGGVNMMDVFMPGEEIRRNIGKAIHGRRDKLILQGHIGSVDLREKYDISRDLSVCQKYFEDLLRHLGTDYIDFGMLFFLDSADAVEKVFHGGILDYAKKLKRQGTIRGIGASSHNPEIAAKVVESGELDLLLFSVNPAFDMTPAKTDVLETLGGEFSGQVYTGVDPARARLYRLCEQKGVGITVMKALAAGKLLSAEHTPFSAPMSAAQCIHYALTRPAVVSVLAGCSTPAQMREALAYLAMPDAEKDYTGVISRYKSGFSGQCVYCSHCQPCPAGIDIAAVNKYLDIARLNESAIPPSILSHYRELPAQGSGCIACGSCEERCPFSVPIIGNMKKAAEIFGN